MDGMLYKWCGVFPRWQLRYCVINDGRLDFYSSRESVKKGEGFLESHHVSLCEITPSKKVPTEWTIQAAGQDLVYLKVDSAEERRNWLRLLGSAKACIANTSVLINGSRKNSNSSLVSVRSQDKKSEYVSKSTDGAASSADSVLPAPSHVTRHDNSDECNNGGSDAISKVQEAKSDHDEPKPSRNDLDSICVDLKAELNRFQQRHCSENESPTSAELMHKDTSRLLQLFKKFSEMVSCISGKATLEVVMSHQSDLDDSQSDTTDDHISQHTTDSGYACASGTPPPPQEQKILLQTFFSTVKVSFADVINEAKENHRSDLLSSIQSETYITACIHYTKFFDLFAGTLLAPLKSDILSNAEKVRKGFAKNPKRYICMQLIFEDEIAKKEHLHPDSATQAVLWMMRGLRTISTFLTYASTPGHPSYKNAGAALETAYREHLRPHHNFVVQRMFTMGLKFVPGFEHFKKAVIMDRDVDLNSAEVSDELLKQTISYCESMSEVVRSLEKIYLHHKIGL